MTEYFSTCADDVRASTASGTDMEAQAEYFFEGLAAFGGISRLTVRVLIDEAGYLTLGDRNRVAGGSGVARELLISAVDGDKIFELEANDSSPSMAFARLSVTTIYIGPGARIVGLTIQLDFADFAMLRGEREALMAFDIGFAILHELAHGVLGLKDDFARRRLGECDERINLVRRDLGLPERRYYSPAISLILPPYID